MEETIVLAICGVLGTFAFFGGIGLLVWLDARSKLKQREFEHAERMKAIELGQTLPDAEIARAQAEQSRTRAAGMIGFLTPFVMAGVAIGATAIVFGYAHQPVMERVLLPLLCTIWGVCGLVSLVVPLACVASLHRESPGKDEPPAKQPPSERPAFAEQT